jgi:hypothetical protein
MPHFLFSEPFKCITLPLIRQPTEQPQETASFSDSRATERLPLGQLPKAGLLQGGFPGRHRCVSLD